MITKSGIYYFFDNNEKLLYIGKAQNFRERMRMHLKEHDEYSEYYKSVENVNKEVFEKMSEAEFQRISWDESLLGGTKQHIDQVLNLVRRIEFEEHPSQNLSLVEKELIERCKPPFNKESNSDEYRALKERFWKIRNLLVKETQRRHPEYGL